MKKRFTEEQIIGFLKEAEAGMPVKDLCRNASLYTWRAKFGGVEVSDVRRLRQFTVNSASRGTKEKLIQKNPGTRAEGML